MDNSYLLRPWSYKQKEILETQNAAHLHLLFESSINILGQMGAKWVTDPYQQDQDCIGM